MRQVTTCLWFLAFVWLQGCTLVDDYNVRGIEGKVIDKDTGKPLEGVMVVEAWEIYKPGLHGTSGGYLPLRETRTDSNGHYRLTARGTMHIDGGYLDETSPWLIYFKPGYRFTSVMNEIYPDRRFEFYRKSDWDGKTIEMEKLGDSLEEQAKDLKRFVNVLSGFTSRGGWCIWTGIPNTLSAMRQENISLNKKGVRSEVYILPPWVMDELRKCPSFDGFYKVFGNVAR